MSVGKSVSVADTNPGHVDIVIIRQSVQHFYHRRFDELQGESTDTAAPEEQHTLFYLQYSHAIFWVFKIMQQPVSVKYLVKWKVCRMSPGAVDLSKVLSIWT